MEWKPVLGEFHRDFQVFRAEFSGHWIRVSRWPLAPERWAGNASWVWQRATGDCKTPENAVKALLRRAKRDGKALLALASGKEQGR